MHVLSTPDELHTAICDLTKKHSTLSWAVAWATTGFKAADLLLKHREKIQKLVVGIHFHQTAPDFLKTFVGDSRVRFVMQPEGTFHPKVYVFQSGQEWDAVIGSANFTRAAMSKNTEAAIQISHRDLGAEEALPKLLDLVDLHWGEGKVADANLLESYRVIWARRQRDVRRAQGKTPEPTPKAKKRGRAPIDTQLGRTTWSEFFHQVKTEEDRRPTTHHTMERRLFILRHYRSWFRSTSHFKDLGSQQRQRIAGTTREKAQANTEGVHTDWRFFGSMRRADVFLALVRDDPEGLSHALDQVPLEGRVTREHFMAYTDAFQAAFAGKRRGATGLSSATRLLAMKRPDTLVCYDKPNRKVLCDKFGISVNSTQSFKGYWNEIIERVRGSAWYLARRPSDPVEAEVWDARTAFLDSICYDPEGEGT
ncbi:MAG: phospholipase D family protein [Planctomycetes bacterium]|nr:phospholipase D family protein [Planctomycetota bacterium]